MQQPATCLARSGLASGCQSLRKTSRLQHCGLRWRCVSTLCKSKSLLYPATSLYDVITDVKSYPLFLPYCTSARVLAESEPDAKYGRRWPQLATVTVGFQNNTISESFTTRLWCIPPHKSSGDFSTGVCETVGGARAKEHVFNAERPAEVAHHSKLDESQLRLLTENQTLEYLRSRWELRERPANLALSEQSNRTSRQNSMQPTTDVSLTVEYKFANPVYEVMTRAFSGQVADAMIKAFEERAKAVLGPSG